MGPGKAGVVGAALVERELELARIDERLAASQGGTGTLAVIAGHPGVGKSALLGIVRERARALGLRTLHVAGSEVERDYAWGGAARLFTPALAQASPGERDRWLRGAARLAGELLEGTGEHAGSGELFPQLHGLAWLAFNLAADGGLVLSVDDAQWLDLPSLRLLLHIAGQLEGASLGLFVAVRTGEPNAPDEILSRLEDLANERLRPSPLSPRAVGDLTRSTLPAAGSQLVHDCAAATGGNPLLLTQLLHELGSAEKLPDTLPPDALAGLTPRELVRDLDRRLARLGPAAQRVAQAAAVLGSASMPVLAEMADLETPEAADAADALVKSAVLADDEPVRFVHPLVLAAVEAQLTEPRRATEHLRAASILRERRQHDQVVAAHLLQAMPGGEPWVVDVLVSAAQFAARSGALPAAAHYLRRALEEPITGSTRARVLLALAEAEAAGQEGTGVARAEEALVLAAPGRQQVEARRTLARLLYLAGRPDDAVAVLDLALEQPADRELLLELEAERLTMVRVSESLLRDSPTRGAELRRRGLRGDSPAERKVLAMLSDVAQFQAEPRTVVLDLARRAVRDGQLLAEETSSGLTWICAAGSIGWVDELDEYLKITEDAVADARRRGSITAYAGAIYMRSFGLYYRGELDGAQADLEAAVAAREAGWMFFLSAAYAQLGWVLLERGELEEAERVLVAGLGAGVGAQRSVALEARARLALIRGVPAQALQDALAAGKYLAAARVLSPAVSPWRGTAAVAAARCGKEDQARALAAEELELARQMDVRRLIGMALRAEGMALASLGGSGTATERLREAVEALERSPAKLELARALIELGAVLRRGGARVESREPLRRGLDMVSRFGAHQLVAQARAELTKSGARLRAVAISGPASLTPSEQRIAAMAAGGASNAEIAQALFVSRRTVETHLSRVYRKLDISSREGLAEALRDG